MTPSRRKRGTKDTAALGARVERMVARLDDLLVRLQRLENVAQQRGWRTDEAPRDSAQALQHGEEEL